MEDLTRCMQKSLDKKLDELRELVQIFVTSRKAEAHRTVLVKIHNHFYTISSEVLNRVFLPIGNVESIEIFDQDDQFHSRIRFQDRDSAVKAVECYDGRCIYDGCCLMELALEVPTSHPSSTVVAPVEESTPEAVTSKIEHVQKESFLEEYNLLDEMPMEDESEILQENCSVDLTNASAKVFSPSLTQSMVEIANEAVECDDLPIDSKEMTTHECDSLLSSAFVEFDFASFSIPTDTLSLGIFNLPSSFCATYGGSKQFEVVVLELILVNAHELFEKMSKKVVVDFDDFVELPSILGDLLVSIDFPSSYVFDPGTSTAFSFHIERSAKKLNYGVLQGNANNHVEGVLRVTCRRIGSLVFVFDPGVGLA